MAKKNVSVSGDNGKAASSTKTSKTKSTVTPARVAPAAKTPVMTEKAAPASVAAPAPASKPIVKPAPAPVVMVAPPAPAANPAARPVATKDQIAKRAYEIWVASGRLPGRDVINWKQAEAELLKH